MCLMSSECIFLFSGNYCPICFKCYEDNDYDSQMMQCGTCNHWVHAKCEDLTGDFILFFFLNFRVWVSVKIVLNTFTIAKVIFLAITVKK